MNKRKLEEPIEVDAKNPKYEVPTNTGDNDDPMVMSNSINKDMSVSYELKIDNMMDISKSKTISTNISSGLDRMNICSSESNRGVYSSSSNMSTNLENEGITVQEPTPLPKQDQEKQQEQQEKQQEQQEKQEPQQSILRKFKVETNSLEIAEHVLELIKSKNQNLYKKGCLNLVLGYFNKFMNGVKEVIGDNYNENEIDDGNKIWHAEIIGKGGFGTVLKVTKRNKTTREVELTRAIKVIPNSTMGLSEAIHAAKLNHPNVVKVCNVMLIRNIVCIEMEYIECGSLKELISNKEIMAKISEEQVKKMLYQCCEVLSLMKQNEMVHSDIKPDNIMIRDYQDFNIAIGDFGLTLQKETIVNQVEGGTRKYWAPELIEAVNKKKFKPTFLSDIYALEKRKSFYEFVIKQLGKKADHYVWNNDAQYMLTILPKIDYPFKLGERLRKNKKFIMDSGLYNNADLEDRDLRKDREFMNEVIKRNVCALEFADESLKSDKEIILNAVTRYGPALEFADESLRKDREFMLAIVKQNVCALEYADESFRKDREIVLEAVKQDGCALRYIDNSLKSEREIVLEAVKQNGFALKFAHESFRKDREIVIEAVKQNGRALEYADESFRKDREIVLEAIKQDERALKYVNESLKHSNDLI